MISQNLLLNKIIFLYFTDAVKGLVISERKSFMPMTYIALILMAYFGPNAKNLGNIQLEIWHFKRPIEDIYLYAMNITLMLGFDFLSFLVNGLLLAYFSKINVLKVMKSLQKDFWIVFAIAEGVFLMEVCINHSSCKEKL